MEVEVGDQRWSPQGEGEVVGLFASHMDCDGGGIIWNGSVQKHSIEAEFSILKLRQAGEEVGLLWF